jgi:hypothetical protein
MNSLRKVVKKEAENIAVQNPVDWNRVRVKCKEGDATFICATECITTISKVSRWRHW